MASPRLNEIWQRLHGLVGRRRLDRDLEDEVAFHLAMREQKNAAEGLADDESRYAARRQFGNPTMVKERTREVWTFTWMETLWRDFTYALRTFRTKPGFAAVAIVTLA